MMTFRNSSIFVSKEDNKSSIKQNVFLSVKHSTLNAHKRRLFVFIITIPIITLRNIRARPYKENFALIILRLFKAFPLVENVCVGNQLP